MITIDRLRCVRQRSRTECSSTGARYLSQWEEIDKNGPSDIIQTMLDTNYNGLFTSVKIVVSDRYKVGVLRGLLRSGST